MVAIWSDEEGAIESPLIVLIHGTMDRSTGMLRLSRRLDDRFRVLRYDRRGYGRSVDADGVHPGPFDMGAQVDDLAGLLAGRRAILIGHSFGGDVAMSAAARHPDLVAGVAIYETPLSWEPWWPTTSAGAVARSDEEPATAAEHFMRRLVGDALWESLPERTRATRRREGSAMVGELRDLHAHQPWWPDQIHCPLVVSRGSDGAGHHQRGMDLVHTWFPDSRLIVLDGCRHDAPISNSELFASSVVEAIVADVGEPWSTAVSRRRPERPAAES